MEDNRNVDETTEETPRTPFEEFLYHQRRALEETGKALEALLPEGFRTHGSQASKEFARGFRVLVDAAMQELRKARKGGDESEADEPPISTTGKTKVKVEVE
ncbi:MAG: hypothetical protein Kow00117_04530 [Phototrophicales bacterium]|nr:MAG: hypothetical protein CUN56_10185 [Phototrophicales bacterium]RMG75448.1 MAG: hypothetical protein D6711_06500 [Chloroflexota bacterium]